MERFCERLLSPGADRLRGGPFESSFGCFRLRRRGHIVLAQIFCVVVHKSYATEMKSHHHFGFTFYTALVVIQLFDQLGDIMGPLPSFHLCWGIHDGEAGLTMA
jgi:hypothetical protein